jgi:agmatine deiminase
MYRLLAEWEEQSFVQLMFPHSQSDWGEYLDEVIEVFENIALNIAKYQKCLVCYSEDNTIQNIKSNPNIIFEKINSNDTWCRDFGGITVVDNNKYKILDFQFNGWGDKFDASLDNDITKSIFSNINTIDFILEGGAIDINSKGVLLTTKECLLSSTRNKNFTPNMIEDTLKKYLGATKVLWLENGSLEGDDTDSHIDMLARFLDDNTIVYQSCDDIDDINYTPLKNMENELKTIAKKENFELIAMPHISAKYYDKERLPASYINFLFINNAILVPTYQDKNDTKALNIFKDKFPNKDIIAIDCTNIIRQHGSLHCLSMQYPKVVSTYLFC